MSILFKVCLKYQLQFITLHLLQFIPAHVITCFLSDRQMKSFHFPPLILSLFIFTAIAVMARPSHRRLKRNKKAAKSNNRFLNRTAMQPFILKKKLLKAKQHVLNLSKTKLNDNDYILLSRGLKFIPNPKVKNVKLELLNDFDELARKMKCRYLFHGESEQIHPFYLKTGYNPDFTCHTLENFISLTKLELSQLPVRKFYDNISKLERKSIRNLLNNKNLIVKKSDKNGNIAVLDKEKYLTEGFRQLNSPHYENIETHDLENLQTELKKYIHKMYRESALDETTFKYLRDGLQKKVCPGRIYFLPKIHKLNTADVNKIINNGFNSDNIMPPGRPIISQSGSFTENIGHFVDHFLVPIVLTQHTYIKDSTAFINIIESLKPRSDCLLVTYDVTNMFTNCPINELLTSVEKAYSEFDKKNYDLKSPPTKDLIFLLKCILENNVFEFNGQLFKQKIGTAIGCVPSPNICDLLMYDILEEITKSFIYKHKIFYSGRYRDDGFIIFHGSKEEIELFFEIANRYHQFVKFTYNISQTHTDFLDLHVFKGSRFAENRTLDLKTYFKPTNSFLYLHRNSCHSKHVFSGFIRAETLRHVRNTNNKSDLNQIIHNFRERLISRGYSKSEIDSSMSTVLSKQRSNFLMHKENKNNKNIPLVMGTRYNPRLKKIKSHILKYWNLLSFDETCREIFREKPIIAYKKHKNLGEILTSARVK